jgi:Secretion system C-terminal sorting domain
MKKFLLVIGFLAFTINSYAQSGQDFASFGDELLEQKNQVEIFPNPSVEYLNVHIKNSNLTKTALIVYSIIGSKFELEVEEVGINEYRLDVRDLPKGYYLLSIKDAPADCSKTCKFLKR